MLDQYQTDFIHYLRFEKRYSPQTITAYETDLKQFFAFFVEIYGPLPEKASGIDTYHIRTWLANLKETHQQSSRSINRKISTLQSFFNYLKKMQLVDKNPVKRLHTLKTPERLPAFVKEQEADFLLEGVDFGNDFKGKTDRLICEILYTTGMRRSELMQLKEKDIEWSLKLIRILGKGNKERLVPINTPLLDLIKYYIAEKKQASHNDEFLLILESGEPLYAGYIYRTVKKYLTETGTTLPRKSPHVLRHSFATHLLENGANIQAIKDLLGHSSLAATQIYTQNSIARLKEIHEKNHPRG